MLISNVYAKKAVQLIHVCFNAEPDPDPALNLNADVKPMQIHADLDQNPASGQTSMSQEVDF